MIWQLEPQAMTTNQGEAWPMLYSVETNPDLGKIQQLWIDADTGSAKYYETKNANFVNTFI